MHIQIKLETEIFNQLILIKTALIPKSKYQKYQNQNKIIQQQQQHSILNTLLQHIQKQKQI